MQLLMLHGPQALCVSLVMPHAQAALAWCASLAYTFPLTGAISPDWRQLLPAGLRGCNRHFSGSSNTGAVQVRPLALS